MNKYDPHNDLHEEAPDIRCFCKKHADEYRNSGIYYLKRFDYSRAVLDKCDKCDRLGFDYIITTKTKRMSGVNDAN